MNLATLVASGRRALLLFFALLLTNLLAVNFIYQSTVLAANTATWVNAATISYQGVSYKETNIEDSDWHFLAKNPTNGCQQEIKGFTNPGYNTEKGPYKAQDVKLDKQKLVGGRCTSDGTDTIHLLAQPDGYNVAFVWNDDKNIVSVDGKKAFSLASDGTFVSTKDGDCADYITVGGDKSNLTLHVRSNVAKTIDSPDKSLQLKYGSTDTVSRDVTSGYPFVQNIKSSGDGSGDQKIGGTDCHQSGPVNNVRADTANASTPGTAAGTTGVGKDGPPTCETTGNNPLSWLLCPIINGIANFSDWVLNTIIVPFLENVPISTDPNSPSFTAWSTFRILGNVVLVGMLLVVAIAQGRNS